MTVSLVSLCVSALLRDMVVRHGRALQGYSAPGPCRRIAPEYRRTAKRADLSVTFDCLWRTNDRGIIGTHCEGA